MSGSVSQRGSLSSSILRIDDQLGKSLFSVPDHRTCTEEKKRLKKVKWFCTSCCKKVTKENQLLFHRECGGQKKEGIQNFKFKKDGVVQRHT